MRMVHDLMLYCKMENYPEEKKKLLVTEGLKQRNYLDVLVALCNVEINIDKIKAPVLNSIT